MHVQHIYWKITSLKFFPIGNLGILFHLMESILEHNRNFIRDSSVESVLLNIVANKKSLLKLNKLTTMDD